MSKYFSWKTFDVSSSSTVIYCRIDSSHLRLVKAQKKKLWTTAQDLNWTVWTWFKILHTSHWISRKIPLLRYKSNLIYSDTTPFDNSCCGVQICNLNLNSWPLVLRLTWSKFRIIVIISVTNVISMTYKNSKNSSHKIHFITNNI